MRYTVVIALGVLVSVASASAPTTQPGRLTLQQLESMTKADLIKTVLELQQRLVAFEEQVQRLSVGRAGDSTNPDDASPQVVALPTLQIVAFKVVGKEIAGVSGPGRLLYMGQYQIRNTGPKPATGFKATVEIVDEFGDVIATQKWKELLAIPVNRPVSFQYSLGNAFAFDKQVKGDIHKLKARLKDVTVLTD